MHIRNLRNIEEYERRFAKSGELYRRSTEYLPAGVNSTARATFSGWEPFPLAVEKGTGSRVFDIDGNEFIDYLLGLGPMILGHRPQEITKAVTDHINNVGTVFAMTSEKDMEAAKKIAGCIPGVDKVRLINTGTEAVLYALRIARTYTGRQKVIRFEGMYHGFSDGIYWSKHPSVNATGIDGKPIPEVQGPGLPDGIGESLIILNWNNADELRDTIEKRHGEIAAVITEPVMCNTGCILPEPGYLEIMRELCTKYGIVLIFDEVITGFRVALSGAQGYYGIEPDLSIFAKGCGGGFPVAVLGGKKELFKLVDEGIVSVAGTYSGNGVALAATISTIDYLSRPGIYDEFYRKSKRLMNGIGELWGKSSISAYVAGLGPLFQVWFSGKPIKNYRDAQKYADGDVFTLWWEEMLFRGVLFHPHYYENLFVSMAHSDKDIDETLEKAEEAVYAVENKIR